MSLKSSTLKYVKCFAIITSCSSRCTKNCLLLTNSFRAKARRKMRNITSPFGRLRKKNCAKKRAAHVARLFFPCTTNHSIDLGRCRCGTPFQVKSNAETSKESKLDRNVFMTLMTWIYFNTPCSNYCLTCSTLLLFSVFFSDFFSSRKG